LALFAALVVAAAEGILYLIWASRHNSSSKKARRLKKKKIDPPNEVGLEAELPGKDDTAASDGLRHRLTRGDETS
jgi:hypothetical protein